MIGTAADRCLTPAGRRRMRSACPNGNGGPLRARRTCF